MQVPKTFKRDIIKFEFLLSHIKIPENRPLSSYKFKQKAP